MIDTRLATIPAAVLALGLGGCANWNAVKKDFATTQGVGITIDAKQRAIYSVPAVDPGGGARDVVCAEPSPDALSALAANLGLDAAGAVKSLGLAFSSQEGAASIGLRTQTIQTLRDAMYRLCEGYAGGALDDVGFVRLQRRYQAVMLGLLAIEQLTGATVANQAALGSSGGARLGSGLGKVSALVTEARQKQVAAQADLAAKKAAATAKAKEAADAEAALNKATEDAKGQETQGLKQAREDHKARSEELAAAEAARVKAVQAEAVASGDLDSLEQLRKELDRAAAVGSVSAQPSGVAAAASGPADAAGIASVADAVEEIVTTIVGHDYTKEACLDWMLSRTVRTGFTSGEKRELSLIQMQYEFCQSQLTQAHSLELAKMAHALELSRLRAAKNQPAASPAAAPQAPGKPGGKETPKTPPPAAGKPAPEVPAPAPVAPAPAPPAPAAAAGDNAASAAAARVDAIIQRAKRELAVPRPTQSVPPLQPRGPAASIPP